MIAYAGAAIVILGLVLGIVKWWNMPKVVEERRLATEAKAKAADDRRADIEARRKARRDEAEKRHMERQNRKKDS